MKLKELIHEQIKNNIKNKYQNIFINQQKKHVTNLINERAALKIESLKYENQILKSYEINKPKAKSNIDPQLIKDSVIDNKILELDKKIEEIVSSITKQSFKVNALWDEENFRKNIYGVLSMEELYNVETDND